MNQNRPAMTLPPTGPELLCNNINQVTIGSVLTAVRLISRSTGARAIRRKLHVGFNAAGRKWLNLD